MMWKPLSENSGTRAYSASHSGANSSVSVSHQCERAKSASDTISRAIGRMRRVRAMFLQKIAIAVAGFFAGGKLATAIAAAFFVHEAQYFGLTFLIGGIVGALLLLLLFDWALIFLSAIVGAHLIQSAIGLPPVGTGILFIALVLIGVLVQGAALSRSRAIVAG